MVSNILTWLGLLLFASLMIYAVTDLPMRGTANQPINLETNANQNLVAGTYYIQHAYKDAKTPNIVTVVLGDYRSIDTFGEQIVIYTAGLITLLVLRRNRRIRGGGS